MSNTFMYLLGNSYIGMSPLSNVAAAATCRVNGQEVQCPEWLGAFMLFFVIFFLTALVIMVASMWKIYQKANKPGWTSLIPVYNVVILLEITNRPQWWIILCFVPFVNIVISLVLVYELAKAFGKDIGFTLGLIFLPFVFYPILGFGKAAYGGTSVSSEEV